ncbi:acyl-CoA dehydrogenase family protein [Streptomyces sp. 1331.2]|uniref:acyl-CoA dehydrogenase family protein n=1 Tax=Streptomyces sp. 1331.2 TaxID=1938835 RepID=UPI000BC9537A|nr:acyl-CoA dehydrogenase family protein [Streptomyces sp. 1331.2]SOB81237.1 Acyl-CoA dehydrogenase [Streptomyces sp. 1331.2]
MSATDVLAPAPAPAPPAGPPPVPLARVTALAAAEAGTADETGRLSSALTDALTGAGFPRHFVPRRWGGTAGGYREAVDRTAALGAACASTAWCAGLYAAHGRFAAQLPEPGQRDLWGAGPDVRIAAGLTPPAGTAAPVDGGWRLDGEWSCVSGGEHADWVLLAAVEQVPDPAGRPGEAGRGTPPVARVCALPVQDVTVLDTWDSTGLRGTGSNSVVVNGAWVPARRTVPLAELLAGRPGEGRAHCHTLPAMLGGPPLLATAALGAARHALAAWTDWATGPAPHTAPLETDAAARYALARSAAETNAAGLLLDAAADRADRTDPTDAPALAQAVAANRRDTAVAVELLVTAVERLFRTGGIHSRERGGELQRCWRDVHTVAAHGALRLEPAADAYAAAVAGR